MNEQLEILDISKGSYYYKPVEVSDKDDELMKTIDKIHLESPTKGVMGMKDALFLIGLIVNHKRVRRLMRKMGISAIYPQPSLSKLGCPKYRYPYLLRKLSITKPNQVWSTDITYIPMEKGFMYLYAIIDVYSRRIMAWGLYNTLEASNAIEVLDCAVRQFGAPEIINSDQGSQYTCKEWADTCTGYGIKISMDGRARCLDNIWIERFWRSIKQEYIYLNPESTVEALRNGITHYMTVYNEKRPHQGIGHRTPYDMYTSGLLQSACA